MWIALAAAAAGTWLHDAVAQTGPAAQPPPGSSEPVFTPLTARWAFPNPDAVNAGTVTIITAPAGGAKSVFAADMARVLDEKDKLRILPIPHRPLVGCETSVQTQLLRRFCWTNDCGGCVIGWMAVTPSRTTSRSGPPAKMSDGASNSRRLAGLGAINSDAPATPDSRELRPHR